MRLITMATLGLMTLGACGKSEEAVGAMAGAAADESARNDRRFALDNLRDDARALHARPDRQYRTLVSGLKHSADALRTLAGTNDIARARIENIETYASKIEQADANSKDTAGWARSALIESALVLTSIAQDNNRDDLTPWVRAVQARAEAVNPDLPLHEQTDTVASAFEDIADSIANLAKPPEDQGQASRVR